MQWVVRGLRDADSGLALSRDSAGADHPAATHMSGIRRRNGVQSREHLRLELSAQSLSVVQCRWEALSYLQVARKEAQNPNTKCVNRVRAFKILAARKSTLEPLPGKRRTATLSRHNYAHCPIEEARCMSKKDPVPGQRSLEVQRRIAFSVREVASQTGLSVPFVRLEIKRGNLRASKVGRRVIVLVTAMDEWLNEGTWLNAK